jgi:hypothetical protein
MLIQQFSDSSQSTQDDGMNFRPFNNKAIVFFTILKTTIAIFFILLTATESKAQSIKIETKIDDGKWFYGDSAEILNTQKIKLRVRSLEQSSIRWFQIFPALDTQYNNAVWPWLPDAYKWKGYATIKYHRVPLPQHDNKWEIQPINKTASRPQTQSPFSKISNFFGNIFNTTQSSNKFQHEDIGSFWYQAEVTSNGKIYKSPGIESATQKGLSPNVLRLSIRENNHLLGHLTSYFNVPGIFGSTPYQVKNYIGVDCADVLMAAHSKWKNVEIAQDYNVAMLTKIFPTITKTTITNGNPTDKIFWNRTVKPGDLIAIKYEGMSQYQHIGALYSDQNNNGLLDADDLVIHAGPDPLHFSNLGSGDFNGTIVILRPN